MQPLGTEVEIMILCFWKECMFVIPAWEGHCTCGRLHQQQVLYHHWAQRLAGSISPYSCLHTLYNTQQSDLGLPQKIAIKSDREISADFGGMMRRKTCSSDPLWPLQLQYCCICFVHWKLRGWSDPPRIHKKKPRFTRGLSCFLISLLFSGKSKNRKYFVCLLKPVGNIIFMARTIAKHLQRAPGKGNRSWAAPYHRK